MNQFQSIGEVFAALRRRAWMILLVTGIGCLLSLTYALSLTKIYEATSVVQIEDARVPDSLAGATAQSSDNGRRVRLIEQRLMSRDNLLTIMEKHDLFTGDPMVTTNERVSLMREAARIEEIVNPSEAFAPGGSAPSGLRISVRLADPHKAADVANDLMYSVIEQSRTRSAGRARDTLEFFVAEEARVGAAIEAQEQVIADFKRDNAAQLPAGIADLRVQLSNMRDEELQLDQQIVTLESSTTRTRQEVFDREIARLREQKRLLNQRMAQIEGQIAANPEVERELSALERRLTQLQEQYTVVTRRQAEAEMGQLLEDRQQMDRFEVLETALEPEFPVSRSRKRTAIMGGVASVVAGIALAFVAELLNPAIRSAAQMERVLGIQPVVSIPEIQRRRDITRRGLSILAMALAALAMGWAAIRLTADRVEWGELIGRILPRFSRS
ncbi:MAG: Wzz/FepE/Etk N-terminal domain-containing protein [Paracoccaceae bacterium]|nr:Wzz/FepE/Etk N-terminal domain-containing protein [Paracoccaceae bacterium]